MIITPEQFGVLYAPLPDARTKLLRKAAYEPAR